MFLIVLKAHFIIHSLLAGGELITAYQSRRGIKMVSKYVYSLRKMLLLLLIR